jgi:large subunit ribosomal protein L4
VLESIVTGDTPSAKDAAKVFADLTERPNVLVVIERGDDLTYKSVRNLPNVHVLVSDQLNTYDVLCADDIVFTRAALDAFVAASEKGAKADQPAKEDSK